MAFCSSCGSELLPGARFCSSCGAPIAAEPVLTVPSAPVITGQPEPMDYTLVLYSIGTCARSYADDVLEDILGYTDSESKKLIKMIPTQIAQMLTAQQAQYIAQALTEYGMQVAIYQGTVPVDLGQYATHSVFNSDGSFVSGVLSVLAGITLANRITRPKRWSLLNILSNLFAPKYKVSSPPRHVSRMTVHREPEIRRAPEPRRVTIPRREEPKRRIVSQPARSTAPSTRPISSGRPSGPSGGPGAGGRGPAPGGRGR